jgi:hypothetical protein
MKVLLFPNGPQGWQTGVEDGFNHLVANGRIAEAAFHYLEDQVRKQGAAAALSAALRIAEQNQPDLIVLFHVAKLPIAESFMASLRSLKSKPKIVYDEGDMYGGWCKPITPAMKVVMSHADAVSIRGLGRFRDDVSRYNRNILYTPHHADIARFDQAPHVLRERQTPILLIGNRIRMGPRGRMPGATGRERFVRHVGRHFGDRFHLHGNGWDGFAGNRGPVDFQKQMEYYRNSRITVAYEHYPQIPFYFSNRLPIALLAGSLYVCHRHDGYDEIFKGRDFIFSFDSNDEACDIIRFLNSLSTDEIHARGLRAREFARKHYLPEVVWPNLINCFLNSTGQNEI